MSLPIRGPFVRGLQNANTYASGFNYGKNLSQPKGFLSPILGSLISAATGGLFSIVSTILQNKYNSPRSQLRRLRKAGLPLAYMYQGRVNQQSDSPRLSIDPDLGAGEARSLQLQEQLQKAQIPKIHEETDWQSIMNEIKGGELEWLTRQAGGRFGGTLDTNQQTMLNLEQDMKLTDSFIKRNQQSLVDLTLQVEQELFDEDVPQETRRQSLQKIKDEIKKIVSEDKILGQLYTLRGLDETINQTIDRGIDDLNDWQLQLWSILMKLFGKSRY